MAIPASSDEWNLVRIQQLVVQNDLERARIEYKREIGNRTLDAIAALANTFGGFVLIGVDETKQGSDRLTGVDGAQRDKLANLCWDQLVPPYNPEIIPIRLGQDDKYVLVVVVDPDYARRPVMLAQGNRVLVRLEGHNKPADWYRLRELFAEQQTTDPRPGLPDSGNFVTTGKHPDLGIRSRLLLSGPRGRPRRLTDPIRTAILRAVNGRDAPLTGERSTFATLMSTWVPGSWGANSWRLMGYASDHVFNAEWHGLAPGGQSLTQARLNIKLTPTPGRSDQLLITLEALLTNPRRTVAGDELKAKLGDAIPGNGYLEELAPTPFIDLDRVRRLMLDILATLWGPLGTEASTSIFGPPLGPPADLDLAVFTIAKDSPSQIPINQCVDFGVARLIPGNSPYSWTDLDPIQPDHHLLQRPAQEQTAHDWTISLGLRNGYQNTEQELARHSQP